MAARKATKTAVGATHASGLSKLDSLSRMRFFVFRQIAGHESWSGIEVGWLLSKCVLGDLEAELFDGRFVEGWRRLKGLVDPGP
jgi:hypothetical protein